MPLTVSTGHASLTGVRERNEDFLGMIVPDGEELANKGVLAAIADGVSGHGGGREAAQYAVRGLLSDYYATPDTWETPLAIDRVANAINRWVMAQARAHTEWSGMATTLTALVLRGQRYCLAHVGDSRCYLARGGKLTQLTTDHVWDRPGMGHVLTRGIGLDDRLHLDFAEGEVQEGDAFILLTDGVWEPLRETAVADMLRVHQQPQGLAQALADAAIARGSQDNASALVVRVDTLPQAGAQDLNAASRALPVPAKLKPGQSMDGFVIQNVLAESRATLLYMARDGSRDGTEGQTVVLKTLHPRLAGDKGEIEAFAREEWLARRVVSRHFPQYVPLAAGRRTQLYFAMSWHAGRTWQQMLDASYYMSIPDAVRGGVQMLKGLGALHRLSVLHRDIKPANIHVDNGGELRILDLGVAAVAAHAAGAPHAPRAGTPSYLAPELFDGGEPDATTDLYAVAVTLFHMLTRHYPYGEIEPFQTPKFGEPAAPSRWRRDIPVWLERVLLKGVARERKQRFETAEEFVLALERGEAGLLPVQRATPYAERDPLAFWRAVGITSFVINLLLLYWIAAR